MISELANFGSSGRIVPTVLDAEPDLPPVAFLGEPEVEELLLLEEAILPLVAEVEVFLSPAPTFDVDLRSDSFFLEPVVLLFPARGGDAPGFGLFAGDAL